MPFSSSQLNDLQNDGLSCIKASMEDKAGLQMYNELSKKDQPKVAFSNDGSASSGNNGSGDGSGGASLSGSNAASTMEDVINQLKSTDVLQYVKGKVAQMEAAGRATIKTRVISLDPKKAVSA
jgi:hypothetical protein